MKIAIVVRTYHRQGGIAKGTAETAERLADRGHEVHIITHSWKDVRNNKVIFHEVPMIRASYLERMKQFGWAKVIKGLSFVIMSRFYCNKNDFDVVHVKGDSFAKFDIRSAHSCHRAWLEISKKEGRGIIHWLKKHLNPLHFRILLTEHYNYNPRNYKKIMAVSEGVKREIMHFYKVPKEDIVVIPNGIDLEEFHPNNQDIFRQEVRIRHNLSPDDFVLLFVGYEFRRKGLKYVIEALPLIQSKEVKLLVIGQDNPRPYRELAKKLGVEDRVIFAGHQSKPCEYYAASDVFVFPTLYEAFSYVVIEAGATGLPVLVTRVNGVEERVEDGINGFFVSRNACDIAQKIELLIQDRSLAKEMGRKAREKAKLYSWDKITDMIEKLYEEVWEAKKDSR